MNTIFFRGCYPDPSVNSVDPQKCRNTWILDRMYQRKWLAGFLVSFRLLTGTVDLLFVWIILSWEVCIYHSFFTLISFLHEAVAIGALSKCPLPAWCVLLSPTGSVVWASSQLLLPPEYYFLPKESTPNRCQELMPLLQVWPITWVWLIWKHKKLTLGLKLGPILWCDSCSRPPHGSRLKLDSSKIPFVIGSFFSPGLLPLPLFPWSTPSKITNTRIPVSASFLWKPNIRHSLFLFFIFSFSFPLRSWQIRLFHDDNTV